MSDEHRHQAQRLLADIDDPGAAAIAHALLSIDLRLAELMAALGRPRIFVPETTDAEPPPDPAADDWSVDRARAPGAPQRCAGTMTIRGPDAPSTVHCILHDGHDGQHYSRWGPHGCEADAFWWDEDEGPATEPAPPPEARPAPAAAHTQVRVCRVPRNLDVSHPLTGRPITVFCTLPHGHPSSHYAPGSGPARRPIIWKDTPDQPRCDSHTTRFTGAETLTISCALPAGHPGPHVATHPPSDHGRIWDDNPDQPPTTTTA